MISSEKYNQSLFGGSFVKKQGVFFIPMPIKYEALKIKLRAWNKM